MKLYGNRVSKHEKRGSLPRTGAIPKQWIREKLMLLRIAQLRYVIELGKAYANSEFPVLKQQYAI